MPIKPENKARYPKNWTTISKQIRERDNQKCCFCGVENGAQIVRLVASGDKHYYKYLYGENVYCADTGYLLPSDQWRMIYERGFVYEQWLKAKRTQIVLTVAHLDHTPENCDPSNLKSLCQRCHLKYDKAHHAQTRAQTLALKGKDNQTSLF